MTQEEWKELESLTTPTGKHSSADMARASDLFTKTKAEHEHPDDYNGPCACWECRSHSDL